MAVEHELTWRLSDEGMSLLERAGLAALYMTLRAASETGTNLFPLTWRDDDLKPQSVTVHWSGPAKRGFVELMKWAWQVRDGICYLPAVHDLRDRAQWWLRVPMHNGIMGSFFQSSRIQPRVGMEKRIVQLDEEREVSTVYLVLCPPIKSHRDVEDLFERSGPEAGSFRLSPAELATWVMRGFSARYPTDGYGTNWQQKVWRGPAQRAILLMLVPAVCLYFRLQGKGKNWVYVVPDVCDLTQFDASRRRIALNEDFLDVGSLGDAGMRFLSEYSTRSLRRSLQVACRVSAFGLAGYFHKANATRKAALDVAPKLASVKRYQLVHRILPNHYYRHSEGSQDEFLDEDDEPTPGTTSVRAAGFIKAPSARGRIADNLVKSYAWYTNLFTPLQWNIQALEEQRKRRKESGEDKQPLSLQRLWFENLCHQSRQLRLVIRESAMWDSPDERAFLKVMYDMLGTLMWKEIDALRRGGSRDASKRIDDLIEHIRRELENAKTRVLLRDTLSKWLAKGGGHDAIRQHRAAVWRLINHPQDWQKARDLARLALVTYESGTVSVSSEPDWSILSEDLQDKIVFDTERKRLRFIGTMTEAERDVLLELFETAEDLTAIAELHRKSQEI